MVQSHCFEGLSHEIFNEPEQAQVLALLMQWLATRTHTRALTPA